MRDTSKMRVSEALQRMLQRYAPKSVLDYKNAIKEIAQEIALLGLWRAKFFEKAVFYGGTALRILHQLDRFSEDLDFSLLKPDPHFDITNYEKAVQQELQSLGFEAQVKKKKKSKESAIDSAFIKINTMQHLFLIGIPEGITKKIHPEEMIKIRFEVDTDPPLDGGKTENRLLLLPYPFSVKTLCLEDLFAGKMHATLCREWKGRVKGRDWYDLVWFVARDIPLNLTYLKRRMQQSGFWQKKDLTREDLLGLCDQKIASLDVKSAKNDIINFVAGNSAIELWSKDFFREVVRKVKVVSR